MIHINFDKEVSKLKRRIIGFIVLVGYFLFLHEKLIRINFQEPLFEYGDILTHGPEGEAIYLCFDYFITR